MVTTNLSKSEVKDPYKMIVNDMVKENIVFGLFSKNGDFITDHFKKEDSEVLFSLTDSYYLAMNLNFVEKFSNTIRAKIHDTNGFEQLSSEATFRWLYHKEEEEIISLNSKAKGVKIDPKDYDEGILLLLLKFPKEWRFFKRGQVRIDIESSLIYNPGELEQFVISRNF